MPKRRGARGRDARGVSCKVLRGATRAEKLTALVNRMRIASSEGAGAGLCSRFRTVCRHSSVAHPWNCGATGASHPQRQRRRSKSGRPRPWPTPAGRWAPGGVAIRPRSHTCGRKKRYRPWESGWALGEGLGGLLRRPEGHAHTAGLNERGFGPFSDAPACSRAPGAPQPVRGCVGGDRKRLRRVGGRGYAGAGAES